MRGVLGWVVTLGFLLAGTALVIIAWFAAEIGLSAGTPGKMRIMAGIVGVVLIIVALAWERTFSLYKGTVLLIANTVLLLVILEGVAAVHNRAPIFLKRFTTEQNATQTKDAQVHRQVDETEIDGAMYVGWRSSPREGGGLTIGPDGLRITPGFDASKPGQPIQVFMLGGSTTWGEGARDEETIPALVQAKLNDRFERPVRVTNFGQRGWVATQNLVQLIIELQRGNVPDAVIFFDGFNDTYASFVTNQAGVPENVEDYLAKLTPTRRSYFRKLMQTEIGRMAMRYTQVDPEPTFSDRIDPQTVAENYLHVVRMINTLAKEYGFETTFFWQPQLMAGKKPASEQEQAMRDSHPWIKSGYAQFAQAVSGAVIKSPTASKAGVISLVNAFEDIEEQIYLDPVHMNAVGNRRIADLMLKKGRFGLH